MTSPAVLTEDLGRTFGATEALAGLDLRIEPGTVLGLLGHNGAGKTTAVRILATLLHPTSGRAEVCGHDVVDDAHDVRRSIAIAGQQATLDERLTGRENLVLLGRLQGLPRGEARATAAGLLDRFGLADAADRMSGTYSGGMRRRLDLAASLTVPRPVVFLDEPTTGLDPASRLEVWSAIRGLVDEGAAVLLTTQYLEEADRLADTITVLTGGRTVAEGTPAAIKDRVGGRRVELVLAHVDEIEPVIRALAAVGLEGAADERARLVSAAAPNGQEDLRVALAALEDAGLAVEEAGLRRPTLDDAFFALTGHAVEHAAPPPTPEESIR